MKHVSEGADSRKEWRIEEVRLSDVARLDIADFSSRYRSAEPSLLLCRLGGLPWICAIKAAPLDHALCALDGTTSALDQALASWSDGCMDLARFADFREALASAGLDVEHAPRRLISPVDWSRVCGKKWLGRYGKKEPNRGESRLYGTVFPMQSIDDAISYFSRQLEQFAEHAFVSAAEGIELTSNLPSLQVSIPPPMVQLFSHVRRHIVRDELKREKLLEDLKKELEVAVRRLEHGEKWQPDIFYTYRIRPPTFFYISAGVNTSYPGSELEAEIYGLRARFIRLLGWPQMYDSVRVDMQIFKEQCTTSGVLVRSKYDVVTELAAYLGNMEARYPVLKEVIELKNCQGGEKG